MSVKKHDNEEIATVKNREMTINRSRMWPTVDSDDEDDVDIVKENPLQEGTIEDIDDSRSSSTSSSEDSNDLRKSSHKDKKSKAEKHSKHKKEKKKKEKKDHKRKKEKKHKSSKGAVDQNEYGKYGIIKEEHFFQKQREFEKYVEEVKNMPGIMGQSKREVKDYFKMYMEDYNTATMPHIKYYHYEKWEMENYQNQQIEKKRKLYPSSSSSSSSLISGFHDDEQLRKEELKRAKAKLEQQEFHQIVNKMSSDTLRREQMRKQSELQLQLQLAYKQGDMDTVRRLEKILAPDEEGPAVKHPWA